MAEPVSRRPLSRRIMVVLFVLVLVPIAGWSLLGRLLRVPELLADPRDAALVEGMLLGVRQWLALVLVASFVALGGVLLYLRREVLTPLASLAARARRAEQGHWEHPPERERPDEIGDLARALDHSLTALHRRAEGAVQMTANLSHELRTPLAAIRGAAELIDDDVDPADRRRFVGHIETESLRLERLVVGLLDMHRADRDGATRDPGISELTEVLRDVAERAQALLRRKSVGIELRLPEQTLWATISAERAQRVMLGLLENAIKFSPAGSSIVVSAAGAQQTVVVEIRDAGPGVPVSLREAIFDRYFTSAREGGPGARGTGLGLAIVQSLVQGAGGTITVDDAPEGGARFRFELPVAER
ncbi:MAG: ATP-binding protein [Myxococcota bacterium]